MIDRAKAISKLELMRCNSKWNKDFNKAFDVAIKELRRTPTVSEDCISRKGLIDSFLADNECKREEAKACLCKLDVMLELIEDAPSVVPSRAEGEWVAQGDCGVTKCNRCGWSIEECIDYSYCPYCGAKMGGDKQ